VIDSGVNPRHSHISGIAGEVSIFGPGHIEVNSFLDMLGHGTAVMAAIQEKAPNAHYFAVKLFHHSLRAYGPALIAAMEWALSEEIDVVNLGLGTVDFEYESRFHALLESAAACGTIFVSAREADGRACLPGSLRA